MNGTFDNTYELYPIESTDHKYLKKNKICFFIA